MIDLSFFERALSQVGVSLPPDTLRRFDVYAQELVRYNQKVNLTAITLPEEIAVKHFTDSLTLLSTPGIPQGAKICDVGTGAGFPGMCLAIARPDLRVTLFDSVDKKLAFLRSLSRLTETPVEIVHVRAEDAGKRSQYRERFDLVTARAVASLETLSEYCVPLVRVGGLFAPLKAPLSPEEAQRGVGAAANLGASLKRRERITLPGGAEREILIFEKKSHTPPKYPRNSAQIAKKPL